MSRRHEQCMSCRAALDAGHALELDGGQAAWGSSSGSGRARCAAGAWASCRAAWAPSPRARPPTRRAATMARSTRRAAAPRRRRTTVRATTTGQPLMLKRASWRRLGGPRVKLRVGCVQSVFSECALFHSRLSRAARAPSVRSEMSTRATCTHAHARHRERLRHPRGFHCTRPSRPRLSGAHAGQPPRAASRTAEQDEVTRATQVRSCITGQGSNALRAGAASERTEECGTRVGAGRAAAGRSVSLPSAYSARAMTDGAPQLTRAAGSLLLLSRARRRRRASCDQPAGPSCWGRPIGPMPRGLGRSARPWRALGGPRAECVPVSEHI